MNQVSGNQVREPTAEVDAASVNVLGPFSSARPCKRADGRNEVAYGMDVSLNVAARSEAAQTPCCELPGTLSATGLDEQDVRETCPSRAPDDREHHLVRDAEAYLEVLARGLTPCLRLREAWDCFFSYGSAVIRSVIRARGLSGADRDDCEQEFWAAVVEQLGRSRFEPSRASLRTWLSTLARNKSADVIRRRARHHPLNLDHTALTGLPGREADPSSLCERREQQALVRNALAALSQFVSDRSYQVVLLRSIEERDVSEVAAILGLSLEEVRYRHCRAKRELRRLVMIMAE